MGAIRWGATAYRAVNPINAEVGMLLSDEFRVYAYALIADAGAPAVVFGWSLRSWPSTPRRLDPTRKRLKMGKSP
ncbi:hypothetical protein [Actinopolymorpha alba]|uniref:hypothetical protein n=1 Tax=Actinopolymorpha alba TaxID=533267 RepID=UPI000367FFA7|nr:hypothetical protein [Actinopolymorpha alba]